MIENFNDYWEAKKEIFAILGVSKEAAHMIWKDACDLVGNTLLLEFTKQTLKQL